ncbi:MULTISPECIES: ExbD/TolR family protein [Desulfobacula]|uniref:Predicted biopolymer transport protein related to ExbD n=2 Tax=Desulfobacula TaxID=28222 RepID=K0NPQ6_DESTT|nr:MULTISPECIES: biopolymer transporter ExbD [Desulfobacula]CCK82118.1 predicted biopolymer transport protein related to ExbD [Desulfobacula toluolica Tol2]SDU46463.1 biopolymer transport protein ExbD [Desulfobacula phenolica]
MPVFKKKRDRYQIQPPMTSLIDIVFLLLIYFMLTTNFIVEEGINIKLPNAKASAPQVKQEITIYIDKRGTIYMMEKEIPLDMLYAQIKEMIGGATDRLVVVKADKTIVLNKAVRVMDIAKAAGASRLCLATEKGL